MQQSVSFGTFTRVNTTLKGRCVKVVGPTLETCGLRLSCNATQHLRPGAVLCAGGLGASSSFAARRCTACEHAWSKQPALHLHLSYPPAGRRHTGQGACQAKQCWRGHSWHCGQLQRVTGLAGSPCVWEQAVVCTTPLSLKGRMPCNSGELGFHKGASSTGPCHAALHAVVRAYRDPLGMTRCTARATRVILEGCMKKLKAVLDSCMGA